MYKYVDQKGSAAIMALKRSAGVALEVNLVNPSCTCNEHLSKEIHPGFETQRRNRQKFKPRDVSDPRKRTDILQLY